MDGTTIATSWADLTDASLIAPINVDEFGSAVGSARVWTHTRPDGSGPGFPGYDCSGWTSTAWSSPRTGSTSASGATWTWSSGGWECSESLRLYCFQQTTGGTADLYVEGFVGIGMVTPTVELDVAGDAHVTGDWTVDGTKSAVVDTEDYGRLKLYAVESPETWFEDFGSGRLVDGEAVVTVDPVFAQTVNLTEVYYVFLTPLGDCALYVAEKTAGGFRVAALGGASCSIAFDYRIVAKRLGYEEVRLGSGQ